MKKIISKLPIVVLSLLFFSSCTRFSDGGLVKKAEDRLTDGSWLLESYYRNGTDVTDSLLISNYTEHFNTNNTMLREFTDSDGRYQSQEGTWAFLKKEEQLEISGVGSIELTSMNSTVSSSKYEILKLDKDEFWFQYTNGGDEHEFHFVNQDQ